MNLDLSNVTLCSIDCLTPVLAAEAINLSSNSIDFGDSILFSDVLIGKGFRTELIPKIESREAYSKFVIEDLPSYISTEFALIVQWDGYVTCPDAWDPDFLAYDYIGATWPSNFSKDGFNVGNGGFSLRSKKLMDLILDLEIDEDYSINEDEIICKLLRPTLEKNGIKFATEAIANKFSYERCMQEHNTFGFHGFFNMWRHCDDFKILNLINNLPPKHFLSMEYIELMLSYLHSDKLPIFEKMYGLLLDALQAKSAENHLERFVKDPLYLAIILGAGERKNRSK